MFISLLKHKTQLHSLSIEHPGLYSDAAGLQEVYRFLVLQESLKDLELFRPKVPLSIVLDCIRLNQRTVTRLSLDLYGTSLRSSRSTRTLKSPADMEAIRDACPNLEEFTIYLPVEDLDVVSTTHHFVYCVLPTYTIPSSRLLRTFP